MAESPSQAISESSEERARTRQVQELYAVLDNVHTGDVMMAWYGQLRAREIPHTEALQMTVDYWELPRMTWWQRRFPTGRWQDGRGNE